MSVNRVCKNCAQTKPIEQFYLKGNNRRAFRCRECSSLYRKLIRAQTNKTVLSARYRKVRLRQYGLSPDSFLELSSSQGNRCAICKEETKLVVDHSHITGSVRGLLCCRCNSMLGFARDNPLILRQGIEYLMVNKWGGMAPNR